MKEKLAESGAAFVGRVVRVTPLVSPSGIARFDYRFRVDHVVKGTFGEQVTVRAAKLVDIDNQVVTAGTNVTIGVLTARANGHFVTSSCSLVDPGTLMGAADEPKGGTIKVVIGLGLLVLVLGYSIRRLRRRQHAGSLGR